MTVRDCLPWPDRRLRTPAEPVPAEPMPAISDAIRAIWDDMVDTMEAMPGLGLAAPQIGRMLCLAVVDCSRERGQAIRLANPRIVSASAELRSHEEASPNLPGVSAFIDRPRRVRVRYLDETGAEAERDFEDLWATSVQHQIDHLAGRMYFDRLSPLRRQRLLARADKLGRRRGG